ncbi:hypothetical protein [Desulfosoma caldarium]|uniref:Uncharacterized protein n=1 Tax=Desulfosoma caldarium TaxID=610254 RepID=A0A3N1UY91_9BACT|nr:hypothetical protein [Desulfosoma caldarium]ROQ92246.1 hypothetical protein EDC27_1947 [Desulfosoma caldarium]
MGKKGFRGTWVLVVVLGLVAGLSCKTSWAVEVIEPVVVTASKVPRTAGNVTQKVDILESKDLSVIVSGHRNLADYLIYQPGVFFQRSFAQRCQLGFRGRAFSKKV